MMFGLPGHTTEALRQVLANFPQVERAVLYGSRAKGNYKPGSDIDLTLYGPKLTQHMRADIADAMDELLLPYTVDLSLYDDLKNPELEAHIQRVGIVFYERSLTP